MAPRDIPVHQPRDRSQRDRQDAVESNRPRVQEHTGVTTGQVTCPEEVGFWGEGRSLKEQNKAEGCAW